MVLAVGCGPVGHFCPHECGQRGRHVDERTECVRCGGLLDAPRPVGNEGHGTARFEGTVLAAAEGPARPVVAGQLDGPVVISVVEHGAVVGSEEDERVVGQAHALQSLADLLHCPVELQDGLAAQSHRALAAEPLVRLARHVHVVGAQIHEERGAPVGLDEAHGMCHDAVGNVFVAPEGMSAAFHVSDARNAVHDAHVVAVARALLGEQLGVEPSGGLAGEVGLVAHLDGGRSIVVGHVSLLHIDARHAVGRGRLYVVVVKSDVVRREVELPVPVLLGGAAAQSEVPFADGGGGIARLVHEVGHGGLLRADDHARIACCHIGATASEGIFPRQDAVARGGGGGGAGMHVGKPHAVGGQRIDGRRVHALCPVAREVAVAQVVGHEQNDVGALLRGSLEQGLVLERLGRRHHRCRGQQRKDESLHDRLNVFFATPKVRINCGKHGASRRKNRNFVVPKHIKCGIRPKLNTQFSLHL